MDRETAATLHELYERALAALSEAEMILAGREADAERDALHAAHVDISSDLDYMRFSEVWLPRAPLAGGRDELA